MAAFLVWTLISANGGGGEAWPTHTACRDGSLEVLYQSCDPLQDFGFSVDQCSKQLKSNLNVRFGIILREDIKQLFLDVALFTKGSSILNYSYPVCEEGLPKFTFCGRRKGVAKGPEEDPPACLNGQGKTSNSPAESRFIMPALSIILDLKSLRENTRFCWNCIMKSIPPWPAPMPPSFAPEHCDSAASSVPWGLQAPQTEPAM
uniref:Lymphocyte antigen 86 n=1 Tax=Equus caballus TaxID=9796 RepID=A0A9L0SIY2_HORSE